MTATMIRLTLKYTRHNPPTTTISRRRKPRQRHVLHSTHYQCGTDHGTVRPPQTQSPLCAFVPLVLANLATGRLSLQHHLQGPNLTASTACAAGSHAIGDAMQCIHCQYNRADIMLAGDACIDPLSLNGFCRLRALSANTTIPPKTASRPFDRWGGRVSTGRTGARTHSPGTVFGGRSRRIRRFGRRVMRIT